jgi:hypothetical protein
MVPNLILFLFVAVLNSSIVIMALYPYQEAEADTSGEKSKSQVVVVQNGKQNSVSIRQSGGSTKAAADIDVTGKNNKIVLGNENHTYNIAANFRGHSNLLLVQSQENEQIISISILAGPKSSNASSTKRYFFRYDNHKKDLLIHQQFNKIFTITTERP